MRIEAPYPAVERLMFLPEPALSNHVEILDERDYKITMTGAVYGYTKRSDEHKYRYTFNVTLLKYFEVIEFVETYIGEQWRIIDHHGDLIVGYCETNPVQLTTDKRAGMGYSHDECLALEEFVDYTYTLGENVVFDLEFVGVLTEPVV